MSCTRYQQKDRAKVSVRSSTTLLRDIFSIIEPNPRPLLYDSHFAHNRKYKRTLITLLTSSKIINMPSTPMNTTASNHGDDVGSVHPRSHYLPDDFVPSKNEVIVGRGRRVVHHAGNMKLRLLVQAEIKDYAAAKNRAAKTAIISRVFKAVLADSTIGFVKRDTATKKYFKMEYTASKTTIAQYFRDALADEYKSSKQYKQKLRDAIKEDTPSPISQVRQVSTYSESIPKTETVLGDSPLARDGSAPLPRLPRSGGNQVASFEDLATILTSASVLIEGEDFDWSDKTEAQQAETPLSLFSSLFSSLGSDLDCSTNPFEPTPIFESGLTRSERV